MRTESVSRHLARLCAGRKLYAGQMYAVSSRDLCRSREKYSCAASIAFGPHRNVGSCLGSVAYPKKVPISLIAIPSSGET